jgi:hypothetical protein
VAAYGASNAFVSGRFNVWVPGQTQYLSFDTAAEAQAEVRKQTSGVVINPAGQVDPALQAWTGWTGFTNQLPGLKPVVLSPPSAPGVSPASPAERPGAAPVIPVVARVPKATAQAKAGDINVFIPAPYLDQTGVANTARALDAGAFFAFASLNEAKDFVAQKGVGVVLDGAGKMDAASQGWKYWETYAPDEENTRLAHAPAPGKFALWFPADKLTTMGVPKASRFSKGAYLSFDSEAEAIASAKRRQFGLVMTPTFQLSATQPWAQANAHVQEVPELMSRYTGTPILGKFNVWVPSSWSGMTDPKKFPNGTYVGFDTQQQAQDEVKARSLGVVLTPSGDVDATQPWDQAAGLSAQALNSRLLSKPRPGAFNVFFPSDFVSSLGIADVTPWDKTGAYLAFATEAEAQAHVNARTFGIIYDPKGALASTQPWNQAGAITARALNPQLTGTRPDGKFSVWFPSQYLSTIGVTDTRPFPQGAYLGFATEAEAQDHAKARDAGIVLTPTGTVAATQPWNQADQFKTQLTNARLEKAPRAGEFSVWFPPGVVGWLGLSDTGLFDLGGAYLSFKTEAEAQAEATARTFGLVLDPKGNTAATQSWAYASGYAAQRFNGQLKDQPVAGKYNLWIPAGLLTSAGMNDTAKLPFGGFIAFDSAAEAQAHEQLRGFGVVLDPKGAVDATQPWDQTDAYKLQLGNAKLVAQQPASAFSVWFPAAQLSTLGLVGASKFTDGAYLPFATAADAQAEATARGVGLVLDAKGNLDATQPWDQASSAAAMRLNGKLTPKRTDGQPSVWFPADQLWSLGITDVSKLPQGAYLSFATEAAAQAHEKARGFGVVLDAKGSALPTQAWDSAGPYVARLLNGKLTRTREPGKFSVWFPYTALPNVGLEAIDKFPAGAYLAFDTRQDALAHIRQRGPLGVLVNDKGVTDSQQPWSEAMAQAMTNPDLLPPPPSGWVSGPWPVDPVVSQQLGAPTAGSVAIESVTATKSGVDIVANVATVVPPDSFHFFIGAQINGNWMPIFNVPDLVNISGPDWHQFTLHVDYAAVDTYLKSVNPALGLTPDMSGAVGIRFTSGHDTGIPGWSQNQGTEKDAITTLPAKTA